MCFDTRPFEVTPKMNPCDSVVVDSWPFQLIGRSFRQNPQFDRQHPCHVAPKGGYWSQNFTDIVHYLLLRSVSFLLQAGKGHASCTDWDKGFQKVFTWRQGVELRKVFILLYLLQINQMVLMWMDVQSFMGCAVNIKKPFFPLFFTW